MNGQAKSRRSNGEASFRQRRDGTWECRFTLPDGRRRSLYAKTRRLVQEKHRAAVRDLEAGLDVAQGKQTVASFLDTWLEEVAKPVVRPGTHRGYEIIVRVHLKPGLGRHALRGLGPHHVQTYLNMKAASGLAPRTVDHHRAVLRRALGIAVKWRLADRNVAAQADPPRVPRVPVKPLSSEEARAFLTFCRDDRLGPLYDVAISTGMRQGELFGLRWDDVDFGAATATVRFAMQRVGGKPTFVEPKTFFSRRTIPLPASAVEALTTQMDRQQEERLAAGNEWQEWNLVFASTRGTPLDGTNVTHRLQRLLEQGGFPRQRFHDLRHCSASLLLQGGVGMRTIMGRLGHSQISLTMNNYAHLSPELERDAAEALDRVLGASA